MDAALTPSVAEAAAEVDAWTRAMGADAPSGRDVLIAGPGCAPLRLRSLRALAELAIVDLHAGGHECSVYAHNGEIDNCRYVHDFELCSTLRLLAVLYADRDGFQLRWRIDA